MNPSRHAKKCAKQSVNMEVALGNVITLKLKLCVQTSLVFYSTAILVFIFCAIFFFEL